MRSLVYYLPVSSETSPSMVAGKVWMHLYDARDGLDMDLRLLPEDPRVGGRYPDVAIRREEVRGYVGEAVFYFPVSPVLGMGPASLTMLRLKTRGVRIACDCHGDLREDLRNHLRNRNPLLFLYAAPSAALAPVILNWHDLIVLHSRYLEGIMRRQYDLRARTAVVPNGIDEELLEREFAPAELEGGVRICFHGRHAHEKGHDLLIEAVASLPEGTREAVHLHILGCGPLTTRLTELARERGLGRQVHFLGFLPIDEVYSCIRSADMMVFPSRFDNFPVAVLEALAIASGPVLYSDRMGVGEFTGPSLEGNEFALSVKGIREGILRIIEGQLDVASIVREQRAFAQSLTWDRVARQYVKLFNELAREEGPNGRPP